ncbi:autotransporter domain-containing protein [Rhodoplanes sp. Z2-YC6860]|uniref:autotransporter domain-containing protein n=1 Tax=Rhodoplanes sp. Z2-YC6860 TaxID=674703 RepID=UPI00078BFFD8|nr:autotransporter domain-containing protein [Rhodoplanes sp. Z2-YC6860]AMN44242.1 outer membrane autotransporter barrel domain-containing protein [Rhodoplanes sp. Z2-YC6860]
MDCVRWIARKALVSCLALAAIGGFASYASACTSVDSISPSSGPASGGTPVTITGSGFACHDLTSVKFGGVEATAKNIVNDTTITATTPPGTGTVDVTVTLDSGTFTLPAAFTYSGGKSNNASQNLDTLQTTGTKTAAQFAGDAISGAVGGAIGNAFSGGGAPVSVGPNGVTVNFAAAPERDSRVQQAFDALAYAGNIYKAPAARAMREWSAWADVRATGFDRDDAVSGTHGHQLNVTAGVGRMVTPDVLVGLFAGYERSSFTIASITGKLTGDGATVGAYAGWRLTSHWRADALLGWSRLSYDASTTGAAGSFDGSRWLTSAGLTGTYRLASVVLEPSARVYALWEREDAWTDNIGGLHGERNFSVGRVSSGGRIFFPWLTASGILLAPYVGFYGDWRFSSDSALPVSAANAGIKDGWSGRAVTGVTANMGSGRTLALGGEWGGIGAGYDLWTVNARAAWAF